MRDIVKNSTDQGTVVRIVDTAGIPFGTSAADTSLTIRHRNLGGITVSLALTSLASAGAAHTDGGFVHMFAGYHRVDLVDAAVATVANDLLVIGSVSGGVVIGAMHGLIDINPYDPVRSGIAAIPNVTTGQAGAIPTNTSVNAALASVDTSILGALASVDTSILAALASVNSSVLGAIVSNNAALFVGVASNNTALFAGIASNNAALFVGIASVNSSIQSAIASVQGSILFADVMEVNHVTVSGDGATGTEWGPAS